MLKFAANLSHLWVELPYLDRFEAAAAAGFEAVEVLFPYDVAAKDTRRALLSSGLEMVLINAPPPNYTGGHRGFAAVPALRERFRRDFARALRYADALRVRVLHVMTGVADGIDARATLIENLRWAQAEIPDGLTLTLEPLCDESLPGYFLNDYALAAEVLDEVASDRIGLQFDSYHAQTIHGDATEVFETYRRHVRHIQIGDAPGRGVPGSGTVDFDRLFAAIRASGYDGWVSAEYTPGPQTEAGLGWLSAARG
ncbi:TIM barrel protein [Sulfitobacter sp. D35]|uniref:hydroxypyruvate isomerase family protein n=1 Tax=Sulfitobacter sp. D35 TaxID=3083252 RepID=UPI00296FD22C|nr:TIM barrel protein [Sulfitobacter sp. D35]MDW4498279.1 TIM barrel protein [Sulfitobacter sp. D35]